MFSGTSQLDIAGDISALVWACLDRLTFLLRPESDYVDIVITACLDMLLPILEMFL